MQKKLTDNQQIILASSSQTRKRILGEYLQNFKVVKHRANEKLLKESAKDLTYRELVKLLAKKRQSLLMQITQNNLSLDQIKF